METGCRRVEKLKSGSRCGLPHSRRTTEDEDHRTVKRCEIGSLFSLRKRELRDESSKALAARTMRSPRPTDDVESVEQ